MRADRVELLSELAAVCGVVDSSRAIMPMLSCVRLTEDSGRLQLTGTDLDISFRSSCRFFDDDEVLPSETQNVEPLDVAVDAKHLLQIVKSLGTDDVELHYDGNRLNIRSGEARFQVNVLPVNDFPNVAVVEGDVLIDIPYADFRRMVKRMLFAVSSEEARYQLNGAYVLAKEDTLELVGTNGHILCLVESDLPGSSPSEGVLVPRKVMHEISRCDSEEQLVVRMDESHMSFSYGKRQMVCRLLQGTFPDYERVISKENDKVAVFEREKFKTLTDRVSLFSGDVSPSIVYEFNKDSVIARSNDPNAGEGKDSVEGKYEFDPVTIRLNPKYVKDFLSAAGTDEVKFMLKDSGSQFLCGPVNSGDRRYLCVIMPMTL